MDNVFKTIAAGSAKFDPAALPDSDAAYQRRGTTAPASAKKPCYHCGTTCRGEIFTSQDKLFCCPGCQTVFELLTESGLSDFYQFGETAGVRVKITTGEDQFKFLDGPAVRERLVDFSNERITRVTFRIPSIHCIACVWLLENLFRLQPGIGESQVNLLRKEVSITFENAKTTLSAVVALLASLGYVPDLNLSDLEGRTKNPVERRLLLQLGIAGFAFGNIMLFSISSYLGLDSLHEPGFKKLFGYLSLALALPVIFYSAADYWRSAWASLRQQLLTIDVPITAGVAALFGQSVFEVVTGRSEGYFDSLAGLIFFLLCGKLFQQKTYDRLAFDRDYKSFFPLSIIRKRGRVEERVSVSQLKVGDQLVIRNGELIPADARLVEGPAVIDYSFVTGESEPVAKSAGNYLYAGGRQMGGAIEVETVKPASQSYLTSLWNQEPFRKEKGATLNTLTNRYSRRFTQIVIAIAVGAGLVWAFVNPTVSLRAFTSVLIVACPCALALAAPFALGTAQRVLARHNVFLKNPSVIETLAQTDAVVFDKTGTLTASGAAAVMWQGPPLGEVEEGRLYSMTRHSTHPYAVRIGEAISRDHFPEPVGSFLETAGCGMEGSVVGNEIWMGSAAWLASRNVKVHGNRREKVHFETSEIRNPKSEIESEPADVGCRAPVGSAVHVAINGQYRGCFRLESALRPEADRLIQKLSESYILALLSGDNEKERERFRAVFGHDAHLRFNQSPLNKLGFIRDLQKAGKTVMMIGDGLNDAGALKQSDVGVAVVENISGFSPASDVILAAGMVSRMQEVLRFSKCSVRIVRLSFLISSLYNIVGISIAASGNLSPLVCAILMPLSSVTVVAFACGVTSWAGRRVLRDGQSPIANVPKTTREQVRAEPLLGATNPVEARP